MLTIGGGAGGSYCDGISRRDFLRVGGLAMGGMSLPQILRAEADAGLGKSHKAVIMVFLAGGPPHQDMFDLKPKAPAEIRGEFRPIPTKVPGLDICEHMPRLAAIADKFSLIRSIVGAGPDHSAGQCMTGFTDTASRVQGGRPSLGSIVARLQGNVEPTVPPFVGLAPPMIEKKWANPGDPGYLGMSYAPYTPFKAEAFDPGKQAISLERLAGRKGLLGQMDDLRRGMDRDESIRGLDAFSNQAFEILTSRKLFDAMDLSREDPKVRARYGIGDMVNEADGPPCSNDQFLMARRLVEAGARCVTLAFGRWDTHKDNFRTNAARMPKLDQALSALIEDIYARGLDRDVSVVVWGEFGRTPKINKDAGRDHWPAVSFALLSGGGMKMGQVIGSTDRDAGAPRDRPVPIQDVFATLYRNIGIHKDSSVTDRSGRPMTLLDRFEPIRELV